MDNPDEQGSKDKPVDERVPDGPLQLPSEHSQPEATDPTARGSTSDKVTERDEPADPQPDTTLSKTRESAEAGLTPPGPPESPEPPKPEDDTVRARTINLAAADPVQPRTVELTEISAYKKIEKIKAQGTFLQQSGVRIFKWMLWLTTFVLATLFAYLIWETVRVPHSIPRIPADSASVARDTVVARLLLEQHQAVFNNFAAGVEKIVIAFLLPLLTAILGYLFGTHVGTTNNNGGGSRNEGEV